MNRFRIALFGSPAFAVPTLEELQRLHDLVLVVTQPARPAGRGLRKVQPPLARAAEDAGLRIEQPARLSRNQAFAGFLEELNLDVAVTAAYGRILPPALLDIPVHGFLNIHASLLPRYRGAAPIQWALIQGETETGITIMQTEAGLDTGPIRHVRRHVIGPDDTAPDLFERLAILGAEALAEALDLLAAGSLPLIAQQESEASYAPLLTREDGRIRWGDPASALYDRFRGVLAWPGSWWEQRGRSVAVHALRPVAGEGDPGRVLELQAEGVVVAAGRGAVLLRIVQPAGKARMEARAWANGYGVKEGDFLG